MNTLETARFRDVLDGVLGRYWHGLADGRIQCDLCPRYCKLHDGQRGLCFVRARRGDEILLTTYGRSSGFCIDPIEKKPLNHFLPGTPVLSFGTAGCNLTCKFCQNWDISKARSLDRLQSEAAPETIVHAAQETGSRAIAYTYNDPVIFLEYAVDTARVAREQGITNVAVTAGYISEKAREEFFSVMDAANIDLKAFTDGFYRTLCSAELKPILETLEYVKRETGVWLEITTLLIPTMIALRRSPRFRNGSSIASAPMCPSISLHFIRTGRCAMCLERRLPRSLLHEKLRRAPGCATFTRAMFMMCRGRAPIVTPAAHASSVASGSRSPPGRSMKAVAAGAAALAAQAFSNKDPALGGRGASLSSWAKASERWSTSF
ncbi:MAG: AmmeMemoRadiSam system radical SAM enzyme [Methylocella sp.]